MHNLKKKYNCNNYTYKMMVRITEEDKKALETITIESNNKFTNSNN